MKGHQVWEIILTSMNKSIKANLINRKEKDKSIPIEK
jgi:hypothetical protein